MLNIDASEFEKLFVINRYIKVFENLRNICIFELWRVPDTLGSRDADASKNILSYFA